MPRRTSQLAIELSTTLESSEERVSPRQIERLSEAGLLGEPPYTPDLVTRTRDALELVRRYNERHDLATLVMFVQGRHRVGEERLKRAYAVAFERIEGWIDRRLGAGRDLDAARPLAIKLAHRSAKEREDRDLRARLKATRPHEPFRSIRSLLEDFYTDVVLLIREGRPSSDQGLREVLEATGVAAIASERVPGRAPIVPSLPLQDIKRFARKTKLGGLVRRVSLASYEQLEQARDDTLAFVAFARVFAPFAKTVLGASQGFGFRAIANMTDLGIAFAVPGMLILSSLRPDEVAELRALLKRETPRFRAFGQLLQRIPQRYHPQLYDPKLVAALDEDARAELKTVIDGFEAQDPHGYELVTGLPARPLREPH
jgi:hypothetical protein